MLVFVAIAVTIAGLIHLYLWHRLVRNTATTRRWRRVGGFAVLSAAVVMVATLFGEAALPNSAGWLTFPGYLWLGLMFYLLVALLVLELPLFAVRLVQRARARRASGDRVPVPVPVPAAGGPAESTTPAPADPPDFDASRRLLLRRGAAIAVGLAAVGVGGYGVSRAYRKPRVTRLAVPLTRLDPRADGLRVAVVADLHAGPLYGRSQLEQVVEVVNSLDADLVTVVGDLVSSEVDKVRESMAPLRSVRSRYGAFFVTGNHEYYQGYQESIEAAEELGLRVLRNQRVEIAHGGGVIDLAGVNDQEGNNYDDPPDYPAALGDRDPARPVVLLAHQPVQVHQAAEYGVDLQLSGHTHGGQLYPFDFMVRLEQPVVSGLAEVDGTQVYVTNGAGFWGPPMRVGADPDVTLLELRAG